MRIVHLSDLHFGDHNPDLADAILRHIRKIKPEVVVVTGDLADDLKKSCFQAAQEFVEKIGNRQAPKSVPDSNRSAPLVICVPGNHDMFPRGFLPQKGGFWSGLAKSFGFGKDDALTSPQTDPERKYHTYFGESLTHYYFPNEKVWIFGFDSASAGPIGGGGTVLERDLNEFHAEYNRLQQHYGDDFRRAYKIALLHHHPLPVDWHTNWRQRFLTLTNAGAFLTGILHRGIDLVLHGHEHVHANGRLNSTLGGSAECETTIVSAGSALSKKAERNWFNVVSVGSNGVVCVDSYVSLGADFDDRPERFVVRSLEGVRDHAFHSAKSECGFVYQEVTSVTILDGDGDARRVVECNNMQIVSDDSQRATEHVVTIPYTSGYVDVPDVQAVDGCNLAGIHFAEADIDRIVRAKTADRTIRWGRPLRRGENVSYRYSWYAVNAFAMDARQYKYKYGAGDAPIEFSHFAVKEPIEELMVVVNLPSDFKSGLEPEIRVSKFARDAEARHWKRDPDLERALRDTGALRHIDALNTIALRVRRPLSGYSYGIQWRVPESHPPRMTFEGNQIRACLEIIRRKWNPDGEKRLFFDLLSHLLVFIRQAFEIDSLDEPLECSFAVFDEQSRQLQTVGLTCIQTEGESCTVFYPQDTRYFNAGFEYGDGIPGRTFKINRPRLYIYTEYKRTQPDYYRQIPDVTPHNVFLSFPVRNPSDDSHVYGVLSLASYDSGCPLCRLMDSDLNNGRRPPSATSVRQTAQISTLLDRFDEIQKKIDLTFFDAFSRKVLD